MLAKEKGRHQSLPSCLPYLRAAAFDAIQDDDSGGAAHHRRSGDLSERSLTMPILYPARGVSLPLSVGSGRLSLPMRVAGQLAPGRSLI